MIQLIISPIAKTISLVQQTITLVFSNLWFFLITLLLGFTFEESLRGFHIIKLLGLI